MTHIVLDVDFRSSLDQLVHQLYVAFFGSIDILAAPSLGCGVKWGGSFLSYEASRREEGIMLARHEKLYFTILHENIYHMIHKLCFTIM
jgi:hypothetical protein